jgi:formylglycine-generating enzyme required for sulfatase activity
MSIRHIALVPVLLVLASCGSSVGAGKASGGLQGVVSEDTAPYALLDIATGKVTWYVDLPDADPDLIKTTHMAFRRVSAGGHDTLVGVMEVTQAQWALLDGFAGPPSQPWLQVPTEIAAAGTSQGPKRPAYNLDNVTVTMALDAYSPAGHARLALPSDAQWTAACGVSSGWWWGASATPTQLQTRLTDDAVVRESLLSRIPSGSFGVDTAGPLDVGSRDASPLGFFDIHGNVWELIAGGDHARGGSWRDSAEQSRAEASLGNVQGYHGELDYALVGMRLVLLP